MVELNEYRINSGGGSAVKFAQPTSDFPKLRSTNRPIFVREDVVTCPAMFMITSSSAPVLACHRQAGG
jgi:hypothetical protein